jgi:serine/threonine protein kinase
MPGYDGWELIGEPIGKGGQGTVYRARSPERVRDVKTLAQRTEYLLRQQVAAVKQGGSIEELASKLIELGSPDPHAAIGALKKFDMPSDNGEDEKQAVGRLEAEVKALSKINHPAVLKLLHSDVAERFIVTEYHPGGTLEKHLHRYKGNAAAALGAFKKLVGGVNEIQKEGAIHRDIKPENIFVNSSGELVLGDFGIVFFQGAHDRLSTTFERVGSHFWMAPWAYDNARLEFGKINAKLDVFPLGKVLWSMISGKNGFPYWEFDKPGNNLEGLFPGDLDMPIINGLQARCVVREENECSIRSALDLTFAIDEALATIKARTGYREPGSPFWPCRVCGRGSYRDLQGANFVMRASRNGGPASDQQASFAVYVCDHCKHGALFRVA